MDEEKCSEPKCNRPARAAFRLTRPSRADVRLLIFTDDRIAPKTASRVCKECTIRLIGEMLKVLIDGDEE